MLSWLSAVQRGWDREKCATAAAMTSLLQSNVQRIGWRWFLRTSLAPVFAVMDPQPKPETEIHVGLPAMVFFWSCHHCLVAMPWHQQTFQHVPPFKKRFSQSRCGASDEPQPSAMGVTSRAGCLRRYAVPFLTQKQQRVGFFLNPCDGTFSGSPQTMVWPFPFQKWWFQWFPPKQKIRKWFDCDW